MVGQNGGPFQQLGNYICISYSYILEYDHEKRIIMDPPKNATFSADISLQLFKGTVFPT